MQELKLPKRLIKIQTEILASKVSIVKVTLTLKEGHLKN